MSLILQEITLYVHSKRTNDPRHWSFSQNFKVFDTKTTHKQRGFSRGNSARLTKKNEGKSKTILKLEIDNSISFNIKIIFPPPNIFFRVADVPIEKIASFLLSHVKNQKRMIGVPMILKPSRNEF